MKGVKGLAVFLSIYFLSLFFSPIGITLQTVHRGGLGLEKWGQIGTSTLHRTLHRPFRNPSVRGAW